MSNVHGVIVLARNGDRVELYQDPHTYAAAFTETTALGEVCRPFTRWEYRLPHL
jgi:hypothetical protein